MLLGTSAGPGEHKPDPFLWTEGPNVFTGMSGRDALTLALCPGFTCWRGASWRHLGGGGASRVRWDPSDGIRRHEGLPAGARVQSLVRKLDTTSRN